MATATLQAPRAPHVTDEQKSNIYFDPFAEKRLWHSVILQAIQDALIDAHDAEWTTPQRDAHDAIKWLLYYNEEMVKVCSLAGCHGDRIRASARKKLAPLAETYREKAELCFMQAGSLEGDDAMNANKKGERYLKSAILIEGGI